MHGTLSQWYACECPIPWSVLDARNIELGFRVLGSGIRACSKIPMINQIHAQAHGQCAEQQFPQNGLRVGAGVLLLARGACYGILVNPAPANTSHA